VGVPKLTCGCMQDKCVLFLCFGSSCIAQRLFCIFFLVSLSCVPGCNQRQKLLGFHVYSVLIYARTIAQKKVMYACTCPHVCFLLVVPGAKASFQESFNTASSQNGQQCHIVSYYEQNLNAVSNGEEKKFPGSNTEVHFNLVSNKEFPHVSTFPAASSIIWHYARSLVL
jgi:hypothetical protein